MRIGLALRAFVQVLTNRQLAEQVRAALAGAAPAPPATPAPESALPKHPVRSEAITLLATLQREARFVDIVKEPLGNYTDEQIGAAARDVLRQSGEVLERLFALQPVVDAQEGAPIEAPAGYDAARYRLVGNVVGQPPFLGSLMHHGWQATRCELPQWSGSPQAALIVAPVELEVK